jgi:uncharacterized protein (TIGR02246 family)
MNPRVERFVATLSAFFALFLATGSAPEAAGNAVPDNAADEVAIKQVVDEFSDGWNNHDAHAMCASVADDVEWASWRGEIVNSRQEVEDQHAKLFAGLYKNSHRTDTVKSIRYLTPDLVSVDNFWTMTGAKKRDGSDWPYRAGYVNFLMARRDGRWVVIVSHTADFNASAPGSASR